MEVDGERQRTSFRVDDDVPRAELAAASRTLVGKSIPA
jgi:hypothetical protein